MLIREEEETATTLQAIPPTDSGTSQVKEELHRRQDQEDLRFQEEEHRQDFQEVRQCQTREQLAHSVTGQTTSTFHPGTIVIG